MLKCIAGLLKAKGRLWFDDREVTSSDHWCTLRRQVTYLPQEYASTAAITVFEVGLIARQQTASWMVGDNDVADLSVLVGVCRWQARSVRLR